MEFDWLSENSSLFFNPRLDPLKVSQAHKLPDAFPELKGHLWIATSGSSADPKWTALPKKGFLVSAKAVNAFIEASSKDIWANPLPHWHVGGLSISARAYLSRSKVINYQTIIDKKWNPLTFHEFLISTKATLTSLVPTQLYDLLQANICCPHALRAIFVGGGALKESLFQKALTLGWNILPTYGLTECSSQVATAELNAGSPHLKILPHVLVKNSPTGHLMLKSEALLTAYAFFNGVGFDLVDPKDQDEWFITTDFGDVKEGYLRILGRDKGIVKIGGETVHLFHLEQILNAVKLELAIEGDVELFATSDERLDNHIILVTTLIPRESEQIMRRFNEKVLPFERIRKIEYVERFSRNELGKTIYRASLR